MTHRGICKPKKRKLEQKNGQNDDIGEGTSSRKVIEVIKDGDRHF